MIAKYFIILISIRNRFEFFEKKFEFVFIIPIGVHKPGPSYSPAIYTIDIAYKIDIPLYIFDRYITGI